MVNTIFYFTDSLTFDAYKKKVARGDISQRTIVFAKKQSSIYMGGVQFGTATELVDSFDPEYLEEAISELRSMIDTLNNKEVPLATSNKVGGIKLYNSSDVLGERKYRLQIDSDGKAFVSVPQSSTTPGSGGTTIIENPFDSSAIEEALEELRNAINSLNNTADEESRRLDDVIEDLDDDIQTKVENMFNDAQWIQDNFPQGVISWKAGWNENIKAYLSVVGLWDTSDEATRTKWSKLYQDVDTLNFQVGSLVAASSGDYQALLSNIEQYVDEKVGTAVTNIDNIYAKINDVGTIIDWMYSGMKSSASDTYSFADILAAAKNESGHKAISTLHTVIEEVADSYLASASLEAKVDDAISGIKSSTDGTFANTEIFAQIEQNTEDIAGLKISIDDAESIADLVTKLADTEAGLVLKSTYDSGLAGLTVAVNDKIASIVAAVKNGQSSVTIAGDTIDLSGFTRSPEVLVGQPGYPGFQIKTEGNEQTTVNTYFTSGLVNEDKTGLVPDTTAIFMNSGSTENSTDGAARVCNLQMISRYVSNTNGHNRNDIQYYSDYSPSGLMFCYQNTWQGIVGMSQRSAEGYVYVKKLDTSNGNVTEQTEISGGEITAKQVTLTDGTNTLTIDSNTLIGGEPFIDIPPMYAGQDTGLFYLRGTFNKDGITTTNPMFYLENNKCSIVHDDQDATYGRICCYDEENEDVIYSTAFYDNTSYVNHILTMVTQKLYRYRMKIITADFNGAEISGQAGLRQLPIGHINP